MHGYHLHVIFFTILILAGGFLAGCVNNSGITGNSSADNFVITAPAIQKVTEIDNQAVKNAGSGDSGSSGILFPTTFRWALPSMVSIYPGAIAVDNDGMVYATDLIYNDIWKFGPDGSFQSKWRSPAADPKGIAVNNSGYLHIADFNNGQILVLDPAGELVGQWGSYGSGDGQLNHPHGIAINSSGYIFVADTGNRRVEVFTPDGSFISTWNRSGGGPNNGTGEFATPHGITVNNSGLCY
jgi:hypothetical protein